MARQRGSMHVAAVLALLVIGVTGGGAYYVYHANQHQKVVSQQAADDQAAAKQQAGAKQPGDTETIARTDKDQVLQKLDDYCKNQYKAFWENTYSKSIDPTTITSGYDDTVPSPFVIHDTHAVITAAKCDTTQLTELQKFAPFTLYFLKTNNTWAAQGRYQSTPPCKDFDGKGYPSDVLADCIDNGVQRPPSPNPPANVPDSAKSTQ